MELNRYFRKDSTTYLRQGIVIFDFDDSKSEEFVEDYIIPFRQSYISDEDLDYEIDNGINTRKNAIENKYNDVKDHILHTWNWMTKMFYK